MNYTYAALVVIICAAACTGPQELSTAETAENTIVLTTTNHEIGEPTKVAIGEFMLNMRVDYIENRFSSTLVYQSTESSRIQLLYRGEITIGHDVFFSG